MCKFKIEKQEMKINMLTVEIERVPGERGGGGEL